MTPRKTKLLNLEQLVNFAVRALGGKAYSTAEMREKLRNRAEQAGDVEIVLAKLKDLGYMNDKRFAENYAAARLENQGLGKMRVLRDLRQRRVAPALAEKVTDETFRETNEAELVDAFLQRKYRAKKLPEFLSDQKNLMAAFRRLRYAGFSSGTSIKVLKRYASEAEELSNLDEPEPEES